MMEFLRQWLLGIIGATMLVAVAESLMPSGSVKVVGKVTCGVLLLLMVMMPVVEQSEEGFLVILNETQMEEQKEEMEKIYYNQLKVLIERELATYIVDKAMEMGIEVETLVICEMDENGVFLPSFIEIEGVNSENYHLLKKMICEDFGIEENGILMKEVKDKDEEDAPHR